MDPVLRSRCGTHKVKGRVHMLGPCPTSTQTWLQVQALPTDSVVRASEQRQEQRAGARAALLPFSTPKQGQQGDPLQNAEACAPLEGGPGKTSLESMPSTGDSCLCLDFRSKHYPCFIPVPSRKGKESLT